MEGQKCDRVQCTCYVDLGEYFCSERCGEESRAQADASPHDHCGCNHVECENSGPEA